MASMLELQEFARRESEMRQNGDPFRQFALGFGGGLLGELKKREEEKRRQENVKNSMSQFQKMVGAMNSMPDNSTAARGTGLLDDKKNKDRKGITGISTMIPQQEMSIDENGAINLKIGMRATTPQEQKAQFEIQKSQMEQEKADAKSQLLDGYIRGDIQEGAILKEMGSLGIKPEEFDMAAQARSRFREVAQAQQQTMAQNQPQTSMAQPQEQPFMFDRSKALQDQKLVGEMQDRAEAKEIKSTSAIDAAKSSVDAIDHLIQNKNYFGAIEGRMPAGLNQGKREWAKNYDFLEAKNMLNVISEMKNQSRTGATGFGQLNREELRVLQNASMKLDKQLDEKTAEKYLIEMKNAFEKIIDREQNGYEGERGTPQGGGSVPSVGGTFNGEKVISVKRIR